MNSIKTGYEVTLSQEAWAGVETIAKKFNLSISELFEQIGYGRLTVVDPEDEDLDIEDYLDLQEADLHDVLAAEVDPDQEQIPWEQAKREVMR